MTENMITWNVANWVTVVLMALIGYIVFAYSITGWKNFQANRNA